MKAFYAALMSGAIGVGCLGALATMDPPAGQFTGCEVKQVYEDGSFTMSCPPLDTPFNWPDSADVEGDAGEPDFWKQLDLIREIEGAEYA